MLLVANSINFLIQTQLCNHTQIVLKRALQSLAKTPEVLDQGNEDIGTQIHL